MAAKPGVAWKNETPGALPAGAGGDRALTGVLGLDGVLAGGLPRNRLCLVEGTPGTGKTTLALQFLLEGRRLGERGMYVTLSETADELRRLDAACAQPACQPEAVAFGREGVSNPVGGSSCLGCLPLPASKAVTGADSRAARLH